MEKNYIVEKSFMHKGYACAVTMSKLGHRCGYVGVPKGHKLYGKNYSDDNIYEEVKWRDLTEEEKEYYADKDITCTADFETPDDGDEILISRNNGKWVELVTFCNDEYGIGDENGNDWVDEIDAWMPLPKGFVKEKKDGD